MVSRGQPTSAVGSLRYSHQHAILNNINILRSKLKANLGRVWAFAQQKGEAAEPCARPIRPLPRSLAFGTRSSRSVRPPAHPPTSPSPSCVSTTEAPPPTEEASPEIKAPHSAGTHQAPPRAPIKAPHSAGTHQAPPRAPIKAPHDAGIHQASSLSPCAPTKAPHHAGTPQAPPRAPIKAPHDAGSRDPPDAGNTMRIPPGLGICSVAPAVAKPSTQPAASQAEPSRNQPAASHTTPSRTQPAASQPEPPRTQPAASQQEPPSAQPAASTSKPEPPSTQLAAVQDAPPSTREAAQRAVAQMPAFILGRLDEPNAHIVLGVIETLGPPVALSLLARTEQCVSEGGMVVEETGKPRTKGGIYVQLLKDATNLDRAQQAHAIERVKRDGLAAKKARVQRAVARNKWKANVASQEHRAQKASILHA